MVEVEALHHNIEDCSFVEHTLDCILVHMASVVGLLVVALLVADAEEEAWALMNSMLGCIVEEHMLVSRRGRKASWLRHMLLHSIVGYMMVHRIEDSFVHKSYMALLGGK